MRTVPRRAFAVLVPAFVVSMIAAPGAAQVVLPPTQTAAEKVANDYVAANAKNNASLDIAGQAAIEDAPIKPIDDALFREYQGRGQTTLGENVTIDSMQVYRPDQSGYPLMFLAFQRAHDPKNKTRQYLIFEKASETDPWKVSTAAQLLDNATAPKIKLNSDGFGALVTPRTASSLAIKPDALATKLAKVWGASVNGVATSNVFEPGPLTTDAASVFAGELQQLPLGQARVNFAFSAGENRAVCFATTHGGALCFFVMSVRETLRPANGSFTQPPTREPLTGLVAPGTYGQARFERTAILAAAVPKRGNLARADVIGMYEGLTNAEATPGSATSGGTPA